MIPVLLLAAPAPIPEARKIEALIQAVADLQGAVFIRNGTEHAPKEAAEFSQAFRTQFITAFVNSGVAVATSA